MPANYIKGLSLKVGQSKHDIFDKFVSKLGTSNQIPLMRSKSPWQDTLLPSKTAIIGGKLEGQGFWQAIADRLIASGAKVSGDKDIQAHVKASEDLESSTMQNQGAPVLVYDASHLNSSRELDDLYSFFHRHMKQLKAHTRAVVIAQDASCAETAEKKAALWAVSGFVKSLSKEIASKCATINLITYNHESASFERIEQALAACSEYFLSDHSSFITGQIIAMDDPGAIDMNIPFAGSLAGKLVLVTGAAGGIGRAIAQSFASEGSHVIAIDQVSKAAELKRLCREIDGHSLAIGLGDHENHKEIVDYISKEHGSIDVLIHNAGITRDRSLKKMSKNEWRACLDVNLRAVEDLTALMLEADVIAEGGSIIMMSSISGVGGNIGQCNYSAAKAGLIGYAEGLSEQLRPKRIGVNAIAPGFIQTEMTAHLPLITRQIAIRMASLGQAGLPQDIADAACFLASPFAAGIRGSVLRVCGGHTLGR